MTILADLKALQDIEYKDFIANLSPTVDPKTIIGIRTPVLRQYAKEVFKRGNYDKFLSDLPHKYFEENNLHAFIVASIKDYDECIKQLDIFLPYIDNWATCDSLKAKVLEKHKDKLIKDIKRWLKTKDTYTVRFAIELLMNLYLDDDFNEEYLNLVSKIKSKEYYINMMIAWYFATALAKQYKVTLPYIESKVLDKWTHNKTIQKAIESYRIDDKQKQYLKSLKIK